VLIAKKCAVDCELPATRFPTLQVSTRTGGEVSAASVRSGVEIPACAGMSGLSGSGMTGVCAAHADVSFSTSSNVVIPRLIFCHPSVRRVSIPSATACSRRSAVDALCRIILRSVGDIAMTS